MTSKASGDNTILVGPTGCMYVANSSYLCTPYNVPWAHTQIGSAGSFTAGVAAAYEAMIRKGKWKGRSRTSSARRATAAPRTSGSGQFPAPSTAITTA
jgi:pyruvate/2-oxoacid:ferredoxin oxidoreductase beta subunit